MKDLENKAKSYTKTKNNIKLFQLLFIPTILFFILYFRINKNIGEFVSSIIQLPYLSLSVYVTILWMFFYLIDLPLNFFSTFILEHRFKLSNQSLGDWVKKELKIGIINYAIGMPFIIAIYFFIRNFSYHWWISSALLWIFITVFLGKFAPILILPLFYKVRAVSDSQLNNRLINLAKKSNIEAKGVFEINFSKDTKKANAALVGIGKTRRIILCDTLLKDFKIDEVETVLAHELGHYKGGHIKKLLFLSSILILLNLYLANLFFIKIHDYFSIRSLEDITSLPVLLFEISTFGILAKLFLNFYSRRLETFADNFALALTNNPVTFKDTMKKLAVQNLQDPSPNRFIEFLLYDHPPISKRLALAERYCK